MCYACSNAPPEDRIRRHSKGGGDLIGKVLTETDVREARLRHQAGETQTALAAEFRVSQPTMHKAITGKTWLRLDP